MRSGRLWGQGDGEKQTIICLVFIHLIILLQHFWVKGGLYVKAPFVSSTWNGGTSG